MPIFSDYLYNHKKIIKVHKSIIIVNKNNKMQKIRKPLSRKGR
jgi:hypothetical protein